MINHAAQAGEVSIEAIDDTGARHGPVTLAIGAGETVHFNSGDLEDGNAAKGLPVGVGSGEGGWRLILDSDLDFEVLSYIRTGDGFLTAMHDTVPMRDGTYRVAIFNPGSNSNQVSRLRLINPGRRGGRGDGYGRRRRRRLAGYIRRVGDPRRRVSDAEGIRPGSGGGR